jgi:hypothetical protein
VPESPRFERSGTAACEDSVHKSLKDRAALEAMEFVDSSAMLQKQARYLGLEIPAW